MQLKRRICLFVHFSTSDEIPYYVWIFVNELSNHFDEIRLLTNNKNITTRNHLFKENIFLHYDENKGYDFGRIYRHLNRLNLSDYDQIACVNDSNILLGKLDKLMEWGRSSHFDFWGIIDSYEKPWFSKHENSYHIQSHFIVFNRKAIDKLPAFFESVEMELILTEKDSRKLRRTVINKWEIGLTQFFIKNGLSYGSYIDSRKYFQKYRSGKPVNASHILYHELIKNGYPFLKKKVITSTKWRDRIRTKNHWKRIIREYHNSDWHTEILLNELLQFKNDSTNLNTK